MIIYRHLKPNGEVFYIGIGSTVKRAFSKKGRTYYWSNITTKSGYEVQILKKDLAWEEACELERILIKFYGRKDLGTGCLVNMTDGGEGAYGVVFSEERRLKIKESLKGRQRPQEVKNKISLTSKGKTKSETHKNNLVVNHADFSGGKHPRAKKVVDTLTGRVFGSLSEAAKANNIKYRTLHSYLNGDNPNKTSLKYLV